MRLFSLAILLVLTGFLTRNFLIVSNFICHQEEIVMEFCVNKDKPELHCDGKCHLSKQLNPVITVKTERTNKETVAPSGVYFSYVETINDKWLEGDIKGSDSFCKTYVSKCLNPFYKVATPPPEK